MEEYALEGESNISVLQFLGDLPMFGIGSEYTKLGVSSEMKATLINELRNHVSGMSKINGVKFLLAFVQQCVPYGSDYDKYGQERFYYPEETLMAATADCEDKAFLMAYLAKELLNINSVALFFEKDEHLSLALEIPDFYGHSAFKYEGVKYVSCEPTAKYPTLGYSSIRLDRVTEVKRM